jgi:hypothetical protein
VLLEQLVLQEMMEPQVLPEMRAQLDQLDLKVLLELPDLMVLQDLLDHKAFRVLKAILAIMEQLEHKVIREQQALDQPVLQDQQAHQVTMVIWEQLDLRVPQDQRVLRVLA